ncbi:hypothetical protein [Streptomyces sp. NPDC059515]|uniref:hypothetical protein n=1 Tax=Streptomyces sp. NPDC059515 TaxID=3346854 RepID=UPI00367E4CAE
MNTAPGPDIRPDAVDHLNRAQAAADLTAIREQWGDLLAAINRPPAAEWPPRYDANMRDHDEPDDAPTIGRLPLTLREHPAPLNLTALDAARAVEEAVFTACDVIALRVQRPPVPGGYRVDHGHNTDPARWHLPTVRDIGPGNAAHAGSRAHGLHWAAVWLEDRVTQQDDTGVHVPVPAVVVEDVAKVARLARIRVEQALNRDNRPHTLDDPCPYCGGTLTATVPPRDLDRATITCQTGPTCNGPGRYDEQARRHWTGPELTTVGAAILAARSREAEGA